MLNFEKWKIWWILIVCGLGILFALPNMFTENQLKSWPGFLPTSQINLGLDLRGGVHVLVEVDVDQLKAERLDSLRADVEQALRGERGDRSSNIRRTSLGIVGDGVRVRIADSARLQEAKDRLEDLAVPLSQNLLGPSELDLTVTEADDQFLEVQLTPASIEKAARDAVQASLQVIRDRLDPAGNKEVTVQREGADRIIIQVPGHW